jgi:hypothetical protein
MSSITTKKVNFGGWGIEPYYKSSTHVEYDYPNFTGAPLRLEDLDSARVKVQFDDYARRLRGISEFVKKFGFDVDIQMQLQHDIENIAAKHNIRSEYFFELGQRGNDIFWDTYTSGQSYSGYVGAGADRRFVNDIKYTGRGSVTTENGYYPWTYSYGFPGQNIGSSIFTGDNGLGWVYSHSNPIGIAVSNVPVLFAPNLPPITIPAPFYRTTDYWTNYQSGILQPNRLDLFTVNTNGLLGLNSAQLDQHLNRMGTLVSR